MRGRGVTATREHSLARDALLVVAAAGITAIAAQISFGYPVPTTLQTFAVFSTAAVLGARLGVAAQLLYLAAGAIGLPVFADGLGGIDRLTTADPLHASGGYLYGFVLGALIVGLVCDRFGALRGAGGLLRGLQRGAPAARADHGLHGRPVLGDRVRLEVRLVATVGSDAVHARRLRVEAAHRDLAADGAGAGHDVPLTWVSRWTLADAPVSRTAPDCLASMPGTARCATRNAPYALTRSVRRTASASSDTNGPRARALAL